MWKADFSSLMNLIKEGLEMGDENTCNDQCEHKSKFFDEQVDSRLKDIGHVLVVMSGKGGVGKSTVATNLALSLSNHGSRVGLLDVDIHGPNIPKMLAIEDEKITGGEMGIEPIRVPPNLKVMSMGFLQQDKDAPIIWRGPVKMGAIKQFLGEVNWGELDYLIIDLPPGTGDEPLSIAQLIPKTDGAIIVTTPQDVALLDSRKAVNFAKILNMPVIGILENMSGLACPHCSKEIDLFKTGGGEKAAQDLSVPFLGSVPIDPQIVQSGDSGDGFVISHPELKSAKAIEDIRKRIEDFIKND